ncbi:MAG: DEAD/DEAH box helicase [Candidatus Nanohalobium sp.]
MTQLLKTDVLESRAYQEVIAASASNKNTLVVLPTGLGKTVIAAMVASQKLKNGKVLFMAPTKPLVEQHLKEFDTLLNVDKSQMQIMTGETRPDKRYELWQEKKIFFGTPQVVENDIIAGEVPTEDFALTIFDEAHRGTGEYSYVFISEKMNSQKLALTASPGGSKEKIMEVAGNLEINNFEVRTEDDPDVEPYIQDKEVNWNYVSLDNRFEKAKEDLEEAKREQLKELKRLDQINSINNVKKTDLLNLRGKLGSKLSNTDDPKLYSAISRVATALKISQALELLETQGVSQAYEYMRGLENDDSKAAKRAVDHEKFVKARGMIEHLKKKGEEHPKIDKLREILNDKASDEKAIVFTEYRSSCDAITEDLNSSGFNSVKFIGQQGDDGMTQNKQAEVLQAFEDDKYDVLVSTSIGEEGLDIPAVDYVIFYEPVPSGIRDIQRAGRTGRQESGKVVVLIAENTRDEGYYWSAHHKKKKMKKVLNELKGETPDMAAEKEENENGQKTLADGFDSEKGEKDEKIADPTEEEELVVYADDRENKVAKELSRMDTVVKKKRLEVADFLVSERTAIERKEAKDFVDSIIDNRMFEQIQSLHQFENPVLIIEGKDLYSHRDIHPNAIRGALASIAIDHSISILWSNEIKGTAELLQSLAKREQEENKEEVAVRGGKSPKTEKELQEFVVAGLPDVNTKIARRLLKQFETIQNVLTASEEDLKEVEGIGGKKAESIRELVEKKYE